MIRRFQLLVHRALRPLLALSTGLMFVGAVHAQKIDPGLWEITTSGAGAGAGENLNAAMAQMREKLAEMSPQQRQMVEQMMASQGVGAGAKPNAIRVCITPEQAARAEPPNEPGCTHKILKRDGETLKIGFQCAGPPVSKGEGEYRLSGSKAYSGRMTIETQHDGQPARMQMEQQARWVAADCGAVKPHGKR